MLHPRTYYHGGLVAAYLASFVVDLRIHQLGQLTDDEREVLHTIVECLDKTRAEIVALPGYAASEGAG